MSSEHGESLERWMRPLPFGIFLALALCACFPQVLAGLESFYTRDYGVLGYPNIHFQRESFWQGALPFWNPYSNCGQPFLAQWGTMTLYPGALIYVLLPLPWSLSIFCFAHVWLGGFGMYLLARRWTNVNFAGALAGTTYVFNGIMFASFMWPNYLVTLGWMPFVVLLAERAWREGGRWIVGAALVSALQMLSGAPEVILLTWMITGALWLCDIVRTSVSRGVLLRRIVFIVLLTSGLMAVQLLPFFELLKWSHRDAAFATQKWQLPLWGWGNFLVPLYNAFETPSGQYYQYDQGFLSSIYLGGVAVAFMLVALFRWPDVRVWVLFLVGAFSLTMAFGDQTPVFSTVRDVIPFFGIARFPVKFVFVLAFVVPLLAGCGLAAVVRSRLTIGVHLSSILVLAAIITLAWAVKERQFVDYASWPENFRGNVDYSWNTAVPGKFLPNSMVPESIGKLLTDGVVNTAVRIVLFVGAMGLLIASMRPKKFGPIAAVGMLAVIALDARVHTPNQNPTLPARLFTQPFWTQQPKPEVGRGRVMITPQADQFLTFDSGTNAQQAWELKRRAEWSNLNLLDQVPKVNGSSTLQTREQQLVERTLYTMTNRLPAGLLDFLGVGFITSSNSPGEWSLRDSALPFVTTGQQISFVDDATALASITNQAWNPRQSVLLAPEARGFVVASNETKAAVSSIWAMANKLEAEIDAPAPTVAVIAQSFYPCWKATLNGAPAPLVRANLAFQAVPIPEGKHRLTLHYSDTKFRIGAAISGATLLLCLLVWWRAGELGHAT
jgi:hypothetical protein